MSTWDYANLSKLAKSNGGPDKLVDKLVSSGRMQMVPLVGVAFGCGVVAAQVGKHFRKLKKISNTELEAAKKEIIQGIREYDEVQKSQHTDSSCEGVAPTPER